MLARNGLRRRLKLLPVVALATVALPVASAAAQAPGLPRTFDVTRVDSPSPVEGGAFGWGIYSADLTGDGKQDLLVAQAQTATAEEPNKVLIFDGATGAHIDTITPPEDNPLEPPAPPAGSPPGTPPLPATQYDSPELAFVYVETMPDLGSCPGGDGPDADRICDDALIGPEDGIPEIIVGSRALRVNATDGSQEATFNDPKIGRGYVIDGKTRAVLKRIDMPVADRTAMLARSSKRADGVPTSVAAFARTMASPQGMPPCAGPASQNNNAGVGPCPAPGDPHYSPAVRIGDLDGGGKPDIVITARGFLETRGAAGTAAPGSQCRTTTTTGTCGAGKTWSYRGEDIAGTDPRATLDTALHSMQNPHAQITGGEYGGGLYRVGDVTGPGSSGAANLPDGVPDYVIPFRGSEHPLLSPDTISGLNMGSAYLFSGSNGAFKSTIVSPDPQIRSQFSGNFNQGRAPGDLGATTTPDILLPAALQNSWEHSDEGKLWVFNGDSTAGGGGEQSWNFSTLTDPTPYTGGTFGGGMTGVGNLVDGPGAQANEVLVGGYRFDTFTEASQNVIPDVHFMNATHNRNLMTIPHPDGGRGDGFGVGITPMGDLNGDGFLDFAVSSYFTDIEVGGTRYGGAGRAWIFKSDNSPPPPPPKAPAPVVTPPSPTPTAPAPAGLQPGKCANRTVGTDGRDRIRGTLAGDEIFGFAGNDSISGFEEQDCIDGDDGDDRLYGGDDDDEIVGDAGDDIIDGDGDNDELFGGAGSDRLSGGFGRDRLAGGSGRDRLFGGPDNDKIYGENGSDRILVGDGRNFVDAGRGNDSIDARNGERDRIICGPGRDRVRADRFDSLNGCERVTRGGRIHKANVRRKVSSFSKLRKAKAARSKSKSKSSSKSKSTSTRKSR